MNAIEKMRGAKGTVVPSLLDVRTGKRVPFSVRNNTLSYMSAEAMAAAFGGDPTFIPSRIGFIYGSRETLPFDGVISRDQTWEGLGYELTRAGSSTADVQVVGFSYGPTLGPDPSGGSSDSSGSSGEDSGEDGRYSNTKASGANAVTFHAVSNSSDAGAFGSDVFIAGNYLYQAVLLSADRSTGKTYIIARVSLDEGGEYRRKPDGFEVAIDWTVSFR